MVMGRKVHLLNKAILIYDKASYFAATARLSKNTAIGKHLSIIKHTERLLHVEFLIHNDHKFKVSRQHHALIHDHIAHLYNEAGDKLEVRDGQGLWLIIDDSKDEDGNGMNELETVRSSTDNRKVQDMLQSVKDTGETLYSIPELRDLQAESTRIQATTLELIQGLQGLQAASATDQAAFALDLRTHVKVQKETVSVQQATTDVLQQIAAGVQALTAAAQELAKAAKNGANKP